MKKLLLTLGVLLCLATNALADTVILYAQGSTKPEGTNVVSSSKNTPTVTVNNQEIVSFTFSSYNSNKYDFRVNAGTTMIVTPKQGITITKLELTDLNKTSSQSVNVKDNNGTVSYTIVDGKLIWTGNSSTELKIAATKQLKFQSITITYTDANAAPPTEPGEWTTPFKDEYEVFDNATLDLKAIITDPHAPDVTFTLTSGSEYGTLENGVFTAKKGVEGKAVVSYSWKGNDWYNPSTESGTITLNIVKAPDFITDVLTYDLFNKSTTSSYATKDASWKSQETGITYLGRIATNSGNCIQLNKNSNNTPGIVVSDNPVGLKLKDITIEWYSTANHTLNVFESDKAYTGTGDLWETAGSALNTSTFTITSKASGTTTTECKDLYSFVGFASKETIYIKTLTLNWIREEEPIGPGELETPLVNVSVSEQTDSQETNYNTTYTTISVTSPENEYTKYKVYFNGNADEAIEMPEGQIDIINSKKYTTINGGIFTIYSGMVYEPTVVAYRSEDGSPVEKSATGDKFLTRPTAKVTTIEETATRADADNTHLVTLIVADSSNATVKYQLNSEAAQTYSEPVKLSGSDKMIYWCEEDGLTSPKTVMANSDITVSVEGIAADATEARWYDLQGREVKADALENGLYIKVQGRKAEKVLVRK
ncbi:MAG: hypothetical protein NC201_00660 [Prevotella sp.]|nr:hypothetical protein [Bacteroides sp.]MCM1365739.1 hypothetical protein [Prevotella sp.]MCM1436409.1 hypothetical protein [Prevotella sp.]